MARNTLFVDAGIADVSGTSIEYFTSKYPGITLQDFTNYDLNSVLLPTCSVAWNDAYPSINEYGTYLQTSSLPAVGEIGRAHV